MYLLSWRVSSHRGGWSRRVPAEPSVIQLLRITSLAGNNTAAELWWLKLEREIIDMVFRHLWFRVGLRDVCVWTDRTRHSFLFWPGTSVGTHIWNVAPSSDKSVCLGLFGMNLLRRLSYCPSASASRLIPTCPSYFQDTEGPSGPASHPGFCREAQELY